MSGELVERYRGLARRRADIKLANVCQYAMELEEDSNIAMARKYNTGR